MNWTMDDVRATGLKEKTYGRKSSVPNSAANGLTHLEPDTSHALLAEKKAPRLDTPCRVRFICYRHRLADVDGLSGKACVDGFVHAGICRNDSPKEITEVSFRQVKIGKEDFEKTVIEFIETEASK